MFKKALATGLLLAICLGGVQLMFNCEATREELLPLLAPVKATGLTPHGMPVRRYYTGVGLVDDILVGIVGFFSLLVDGEDEATHRFSSWFLPQLSPLLVHMYWETTRSKSRLVLFPTIFPGMLMQRWTGGVILPMYFIASILTSSAVPEFSRGDTVAKARALLPAIALGFFLPTAMLFLLPTDVPLDIKQIIAAAWQPAPLWISIVYNVLRVVFPSARKPSEGVCQASFDAHLKSLAWVKRTYILCGIMSAVAHITILSVTMFDPSQGALRKFLVPYTWYPYLPFEAPTSDVADYRRAIRQFFQLDWLFITLGALVYFAYCHAATARQGKDTSLGGWLWRMGVLSVLGSPGAAFAWAAALQEERYFALQQEKRE